METEWDETIELNPLWLEHIKTRGSNRIPRKCLRCDKKFRADSKFIRMCERCRRESD